MAALEVKDLVGLSEPIKKLIEVCAEGIGAVARPWLIQRDAQALALAQKELKQAGLELAAANFSSIDSQIAARIDYREAKIHRNLCNVVAAAEQSLPDSVSKENLDNDWIGRFFSYAQDVSNEEMQQIWGRLLSGEVARPGTFSLRTLDLVRNLSVKEAYTFQHLAKYLLQNSFCVSPHPTMMSFKKTAQKFEIGSGNDDWNRFYEENGISPEDFTLLEEIQLLVSPMGSKVYTWKSIGSKSPIIVETRRNEAIAFINPSATENEWSLAIGGQNLTHIAQQLVHLMQPVAIPHELIKHMNDVVQPQGLSCRLALRISTGQNPAEWQLCNENFQLEEGAPS